MSLGRPSSWPTADHVIAHRFIAVDGIQALDHLAQVHYQPNLDHPWCHRLPEIRGMKPADWAYRQRVFEENEERAAVMRLYAGFEGLVRRDGLWRGTQPTAAFHTHFMVIARKHLQSLRTGKGFVSIGKWLGCWGESWKTSPGQGDATTPQSLGQVFTLERNPLMHNDHAIAPPLSRVQQQLDQAYASFRAHANDFGDCDAALPSRTPTTASTSAR